MKRQNTPILDYNVIERPLWVPPNVGRLVKELILTPLQHPSMYHPHILPVRRVFLVFGRDGVGKKTSLIQELKENGIPSLVTTMVPGHMEHAYAGLLQASQAAREAKEPTVIIVEHGEQLCFEPRSTIVRRGAIELQKLVEGTNNFLVVLSDTPPATDDRDPLQKLFFSQFDKGVYAECPDQSFRAAFLRYKFRQYKRFVDGIVNVNVTVDLKEEDFVEMAMLADYCTPKQMEVWCQRLFYSWHLPDKKDKAIDISLLQDEDNGYIFNVQGAPSIVLVTT